MAYIGTFPSDPGFSAAGFKMNAPTKKTVTTSGRMTRLQTATTLWTGTLVFPPMTLLEFRPIQAFIALTQGALNEFDIVIQNVSLSTSPNRDTAVCTVNGNHSVGDTTIAINSNISSGNVVKAGDVVRFAGHSKVYMATSDINTLSGGQGTLNIQPALLESVSNGAAITTHNTPFRMILANDTQEFGYQTNSLVSYELDVREVF